MTRRKTNGIIKTLAVLFAAALLSLCFFGCSRPQPDPDDGYEATRMEIRAEVNADCTVDVVEEMTILYNEISHGWARYLPTNSGEQYRSVKAEGDEYELSHDSGFFVVCFGSEDRYYIPGQTVKYKISYTVMLPQIKDDTFIYNFIGNDYDMVRRDITVTVDFPAAVTNNAAYYGKTNSDDDASEVFDISLSENGTRITAVMKEDKELQPFEGLTVKADLPSGTFEKGIDVPTIIAVAASIILASAAVLVKLFFARDDKPVAVVNFYPPKSDTDRQLSPAQAGMLIDNTCSAEDVTSLLFFWASKGCIEIDDRSGDTKLIYKSDLDGGAPEYEKLMFKQIFDGAETDEDGEKYTMLSSLTNKFYNRVSAVQSAVTAEYKSRMYSSKNAALSFVFILLAAVSMFAVTQLSYFGISAGWFNFFPLASFIPAIFAYGIGSFIAYNRFKISFGKRAGYTVLFALFTAVSSAVCVFLIPANALNIASKIAIAAAFAVTVFASPFMNKRTKFYNDKLGELIGFRDFLKYAEKDKLEMLLEDNPQYYYDILPYANALGVSSVWQDKFEGLTLAPPRYYRMNASDVFTVMVFNDMFRRTSARCRTTMTSRPQASSSGRSGGGFGSGGGGGFSGGGFGGGGSRRW